MNGVLTLSTSPNQACRRRNYSCGSMSTNQPGNHLFVLLSLEPRGPSHMEGEGLHLRCEVLILCHRALLEGSSALAGSECLQTSYRPTQEVLLCLTCVSSCHEARGWRAKPSSRD